MTLPAHLTLELVTPERSVALETVDEVEIPGIDGYLGVLPGHTPLLVALKVGELWYRKGEERTFVSVAFGFAEVLPDRVRVLAQVAESANDIDIDRAEAAANRAREKMASSVEDVDFERAQLALLKSTLRLEVSKKARSFGS
ncbi:MAG TPA: F0F1 ATP synthase subunit epsilon [Acidobacteria bacterium]|jgi:F-type H+-transporting ATPase subunit epsilon|nr:F0F1 ATP synthase subunit epsilon [Acidobacteriota bacterium]